MQEFGRNPEEQLQTPGLDAKATLPDGARLLAAAESHIRMIYRFCMESFLKDHDISNEALPKALQVWDQFVADETAVIPELTEELKTLFVAGAKYYSARIKELQGNSSWSAIFEHELGDWDNLISLGVQYCWDTDRLIEEHRRKDHFESALKHGADPSIGEEALLQLMRQKSWESAIKLKDAMGVSLGASDHEIQLELDQRWKKAKEYLSPLLGKPPSEVTLEDVRDFLRNPER